MVSVSSSHLIIFIAAITAAAGVAHTFTGSTMDITQSIDSRSDNAATSIATDLSIISDAGSDAVYNSTEENVTVLVKNTGSTTLSKNPDQIDVLIDGKYETIDSVEIAGNASTWKPGEVARLTVSKKLETGEHRIVVVAEGDRDTFRFHV